MSSTSTNYEDNDWLAERKSVYDEDLHKANSEPPSMAVVNTTTKHSRDHNQITTYVNQHKRVQQWGNYEQ